MYSVHFPHIVTVVRTWMGPASRKEVRIMVKAESSLERLEIKLPDSVRICVICVICG